MGILLLLLILIILWGKTKILGWLFTFIAMIPITIFLFSGMIMYYTMTHTTSMKLQSPVQDCAIYSLNTNNSISGNIKGGFLYFSGNINGIKQYQIMAKSEYGYILKSYLASEYEIDFRNDLQPGVYWNEFQVIQHTKFVKIWFFPILTIKAKEFYTRPCIIMPLNAKPVSNYTVEL